MDPNLLLQAIQSHAWPTVTGCVLLLVVYLARLPALAVQWQRLPPWSRPLVPVALGIVSGVAEALTTGHSWVAALLTQVLAALPALAVALPSPTAHLGMVVLPDTPVVQRLASQPTVVIRDTPDELADAVLKNLDRDTTPTGE